MIEQHRILNDLAELADLGMITITMTECLSPIHAANLRLAHERVKTGKMIGKLVLAQFN